MKRKSIKRLAYRAMMRKAALKATEIPTPWGPIKLDESWVVHAGMWTKLSELSPAFSLRAGDIIYLGGPPCK